MNTACETCGADTKAKNELGIHGGPCKRTHEYGRKMHDNAPDCCGEKMFVADDQVYECSTCGAQV